jgi:hypothetical protein
MFEFDWRSPETCAKLQTAEAAETADFAWECWRRSSDYKEKSSHETTTTIVKNRGIVVIEDLKIKSMAKSGRALS